LVGALVDAVEANERVVASLNPDTAGEAIAAAAERPHVEYERARLTKKFAPDEGELITAAIQPFPVGCGHRREAVREQATAVDGIPARHSSRLFPPLAERPKPRPIREVELAQKVIVLCGYPTELLIRNEMLDVRLDERVVTLQPHEQGGLRPVHAIDDVRDVQLVASGRADGLRPRG